MTRVAEPSAAPTRPPEPNESCVHPVVRTHTRTGRESLFVNPLFTRHFEGMSPAETAPLLGEHSRQIAKRLLGLADDEIQRLVDEGVLEDPPAEFVPR